MKRAIGWLVIGALAAGAGAWYMLRDAHPGAGAGIVRSEVDPDTMRLVPEGVRVRVEVLNATDERGLARRAMLYLRERGFDVVAVGNAAQRLDTSLVLDRRGNPEWAAWAGRAVGPATVEIRPDTSRYLDITILLGRAFRPPPQILYP